MQPIQRQRIPADPQHCIRKAYNPRSVGAGIYAGYNAFIFTADIKRWHTSAEAARRRRGLKAGKDILNACGTIIIGVRYGISGGMAAEIEAAAGKDTIIIV